MGISGILVVIAVIVVIFTFGQRKPVDVKSHKQTITPTVTQTPTPSPTNAPTPTQEMQQNTQQKIPTSTPTPTPTPSTNNQQTSQNNTSSFIYPNAHQTGSSGNTIYLESSDDPTTITNWYKDRIRSMGMNTTSFVVTNTNDNVNNQLAAAGNGKSIRVEITKASGESTVKIAVTSS